MLGDPPEERETYANAQRSESGTMTRYYYDGGNVIAEGIVGSNGAMSLKARYIRGRGLAAQEDGNGKAYYLHNGHGDVIELRDSTGNLLLNSYTYDMWGSPLTEAESVANSFRYSVNSGMLRRNCNICAPGGMIQV